MIIEFYSYVQINGKNGMYIKIAKDALPKIVGLLQQIIDKPQPISPLADLPEVIQPSETNRLFRENPDEWWYQADKDANY